MVAAAHPGKVIVQSFAIVLLTQVCVPGVCVLCVVWRMLQIVDIPGFQSSLMFSMQLSLDSTDLGALRGPQRLPLPGRC